MNYTECLNDIIKNSKLTNKEIIEKLKEKNIKITPNYLSVLKNDTSKIASPELSKALGEVCNAEYKNELVIQGYLDKMPQEIDDFITFSYNQTILTMVSLVQSDEDRKLLEDSLSKFSKAKFISYVLENQNNFPVNEWVPDLVKSATTKKDAKKKYVVIPMSEEDSIKYIDENIIKNML